MADRILGGELMRDKLMVVRKISLVIVILLMISSIVPIRNVSAVTQTSYYVDSVNGSNSNPGTLSQPFLTIQKARDVVRTINSNMTGDIYIYLRGGTYALTSTLVFNSNDSGSNGYNIIYKNYTGENPVISGGQSITGWTLHDAAKNIWKATVDPALETRQIYVNGVRAIRARSTGGLPGASLTTTGYTTTDTTMQNWGNKSDLEFVYNILWSHMRVGVSSIAGTTLVMKNPGWDMAKNKEVAAIKPGTSNIQNPTYMENAYELLDSEGEWYLDRTADKLYYKPRTGENVTTATIIAAKLETLIDGQGTIGSPVHNIRFEGLAFAYATWLNPNSGDGYASIQADYSQKPYASSQNSYDLDNWVPLPANVRFSAAKNIYFERNKFYHLGASGLSFDTGSQDNTVSGSEFTDISGSGIHIGGITWNDSYPSDPRYIVKNNEVKNNYIHNIGSEYFGSVGVFAGYTENTKIDHNEIADVPYSGISLGWGWGGRDFADIPVKSQQAIDDWVVEHNVPQTSKNNVITNNHIHNTMNLMMDGGSIYVQGANPGGLIEGNYVHNQNNHYGSIYLDTGSRYYTVRNNIAHSNIENVLPAGYDNGVEFNYWDIDNGMWGYKSTGFTSNNFLLGNGNVPSYILDNVGLESAYLDLLPRSSVNLAVGKTARGLYNDGTAAIMQSGAEAYKAVDGNVNTVAIAANQFAWTEEVDLGNIYSLDRVVTVFSQNPPNSQNLYATDYEIQVSTTGGQGNFTTVKTVTGSTGGTSEQTFAAVNARYVRIKALKPDGAGQTGAQMAIADLQVYGRATFTPAPIPQLTPLLTPSYNLAYGQIASAFYNDGSAATMLSGSEADKAVDSNNTTFATVANPYAWTLQVDLGMIHNINRVKLLFPQSPQNLYATDYEIQVSTTGGQGNFTTVKTVTGGTGGASEQTFTPVSARYVRIKAVKPDAAGQTGTQMAIADLQVFEYYDSAYGKPATGWYNNGSAATMYQGMPASNAVDYSTVTGAMATNQYAWTEKVDFGAAYSIEKLNIAFLPNNWATDFEISYSMDDITYLPLWTFNNFGAAGERLAALTPNFTQMRYVKVKVLKPDGPNQTGSQAAISNITALQSYHALRMSELTDTQTAEKYYYRSISTQPFTFQAGDVVAYDVKLGTNDAEIGGIDISNTDGTRFKNAAWQDQNGITGTPLSDLSSRAFGKWYHREMTVPASMVGKTSNKWMLAFENNSVNKLLQADYANIVVKRAGSTVLTVYKSGNPLDNTLFESSHYLTDGPVNYVNRN